MRKAEKNLGVSAVKHGPGPPSLWLDRLAELWRVGGPKAKTATLSMVHHGVENGDDVGLHKENLKQVNFEKIKSRLRVID